MPRKSGSSFNLNLRFGSNGVSVRPYFKGRRGGLLALLFGKRYRLWK